jgi:hypothetical protein
MEPKIISVFTKACLSLVLILRQLNPIHILKPHFFISYYAQVFHVISLLRDVN